VKQSLPERKTGPIRRPFFCGSQERKQPFHLQERARPAVGNDQWHSLGRNPPLVQKMNLLAVNFRQELWQPVYSLFMNAPIKWGAPLIQEARQKIRVGTVIPTIRRQGVWKA
jgi:hypothetical protein